MTPVDSLPNPSRRYAGALPRFALGLGAGVLLLGAAACSSTGTSAAGDPNQIASLAETGGATGTTAAGPDDRTPEQRAMDNAKCMREHGVTNFPDPKVDANGQIQRGLGDSTDIDRNSQTFRDAMEACRSNFGGGGGFRLDAAQQTKMQDALLAYTACLREQGLEVKDPDVSQGFGRANGAGGAGGGAAGTPGPGAGGTPGQAPGGAGGGPDGGQTPRGPDGGNRGNFMLRGLGLDPNDPKVTAANEVCQPVLQKAMTDAGIQAPGQGGGPGAGGPPPGS